MATNKMLVDMVEGQVLSVEEAIELAPLSAPAGPRRTALAAERDQVLGIGHGLRGGAVVAPIAIGEAGVRRLIPAASPILVVGEADDATPAALSACSGLLIACATAADHPLVAAARARGIPTVTGVRRLGVNEMLGLAAFPGEALREGDTLALDGGSGVVAVAGAREIVITSSFSAAEILSWSRGQTGVEIAPEAPAGWTVVTAAEDLAAADPETPMLIDLAAGTYAQRERLLRLVATIPDGVPLGLRPPAVLADTLRLPPAGWELLVADRVPVMDLLAAKLALLAKRRLSWTTGDAPSAGQRP
jgi:hypothetical protein